LEGSRWAPQAFGVFDVVLDVGLGAVAGVEPLELPGGGVGGERAVAPVRVLAEFGLLTGLARGAAGDHPQIGGPALEQVDLGRAAGEGVA
jgi:hypothetical protein